MWTGYDSRPRADFVWDAWESNVRIDEKVLNCIVFIGVDSEGPFVPHGTGFFAVKATSGRLFQHIIAARHVIEGIGLNTICIRINTLDGRVEHTYTEPDDWIFHPDEAVDVAVCPTHVPLERYDIKHINLDAEMATADVFEQEMIGVGDDVFTAGLFTRHVGETLNAPIVRAGILAGIPFEKVETNRGFVDAYLVEVRSIAGLSGSPVFLQMAPFRVMSGGNVRQSKRRMFYFLGMMQGHHVTANPIDVVSPDEDAPGDMNTGIGVVIRCEKILEVVNLPQLNDERERTVAEVAKNSGFVEDSAIPEPTTTDENLRHKEDFNSLLDAAVKGPQSDDQT